MTPSDEEEAERLYPDNPNLWKGSHSAERAAYIKGRRDARLVAFQAKHRDDAERALAEARAELDEARAECSYLNDQFQRCATNESNAVDSYQRLSTHFEECYARAEAAERALAELQRRWMAAEDAADNWRNRAEEAERAGERAGEELVGLKTALRLRDIDG